MIIQNYIHHFINYHRSLSSLDDEDLYIEEFSYRDNARRITSLVSEQLKQPDFTFTGVSVSWKKLCMINKKGNFKVIFFTHVQQGEVSFDDNGTRVSAPAKIFKYSGGNITQNGCRRFSGELFIV